MTTPPVGVSSWEHAGGTPVIDPDWTTDGPDDLLPPTAPPRRKRLLLIAILLALVSFLGMAGWYLVTRKPIEIPLPAIVSVNPPGFAFAAFGVTSPVGVAVAADGSRIYASQSGATTHVAIYDGAGKQVGTIEPPEDGANHSFLYLSVNPATGDLYVSDRIAGAVYIYSADGIYRRAIETSRTLPAFQPLGTAFDRAGNLYVVDLGGAFASVRVFDPNEKLVRTLGKVGQFNFPNGVAVDSAGKVYVADSNNGRLAILDQTGRMVASIRRGTAAGQLGLPRGVAIDDQGRIYVVDTTAQEVQIYGALADGERSPKYLASFGSSGGADSQLTFPNGIATDSRGRVYVADTANDRVQVWSY